MSQCDIIIPVWNQLKSTRECVFSIMENTYYPYRIVVIDNGSDPETRDFLNDFAEREKERVVLLRNAVNEGFIKAVNKGVAVSDSEFVCLLNNDTVVTKSWLNEMINVMNKDPSIGIVNPSSNSLGQRIPAGMAFNEYAEKIKAQSGQCVDLGTAFGFCYLVRRKLFSEIGLFDEIYGMGNFEETDFSMKARKKGYKIVRALASYVYHKEGSSSFSLLERFKEEFEKNKMIFESRWGRMKRILVIVRNAQGNQSMCLEKLLGKYARENSWVYIISPLCDTRKFYKKYSNLTFYHFNRAFYLMAFFKLIFKKKKLDDIYVDSPAFFRFLKKFRFLLRSAEIRKINGVMT